jgi:hypothetical protein
MTIPELLALVRRHGATSGLDRIVVAAALAESGGNPRAVGDNGHSYGLWQMHDQGLGAGMSAEARMDPDTAAAVMLPVFQRWYAEGMRQGYEGELLARYTCIYTERPYGFPDLYCTAANHYADRWHSLAGEAPPPPDVAPPSEGEVALLRTELAAERSWGSAIQHDVILRSRQDLDLAVHAQNWDLVRSTIEWLRKHEA